MKRKVFFFSIILPLVATANIAAVSLMSSCSSIKGYYDKNVVRKFAGDASSKVYSELPTVNYSFNNLFSGTKNYNHGNYMLIIGAIGDPNNNGLVSDPSSTTTNCEMKDAVERWKNTMQMSKVLENIHDKDHKRISVDLLIYQALPNNQIGNRKFDGLIKQDDVTNKKNFQAPSGASDNLNDYINNPFLRYSDDKTFIKKQYRNQYVRNDAAAKTYRNLISYIRNLQVSGMTTVIETNPIVVMSRWDKTEKRVETKIKQYTAGEATQLANSDINAFYNNR